MLTYDAVADAYDRHFDRPVDRWEDERLTALLRPLVDGRRVLDLGCGTGWVLDHLEPASYVGVDASAGMLDQLLAKHPGVEVVKAEVGARNWLDDLAGRNRYDSVLSTWAAHDLGSPFSLLLDLKSLCRPGAVVALHGSTPRYARRKHYVIYEGDEQRNYLQFTPANCDFAAKATGTALVEMVGTGALPDGLARWKPLWRAALAAPPRLHWGFVAIWRL